MRVSNQMMNQMLSNSVQTNQSGVYAQERKIASGKKISLAADDPTAWARAEQLKQQKNETLQYAKNIDTVESHLLSLDQTLGSVTEVLQRASELAVQGSDSTLSDVNRAALAVQVDNLLGELLDLANSDLGGQYQFSGVQTQTEPFTATRNTDGEITAVSYGGGDFATMVEVASGDSLPKQLVGGGSGDNGLFISSTGNAFDTLIQIRDQLNAGDNLAENGLQEQVDAVAEKMLVNRAGVGAYLEHAGFVADIHSNREVSLSESISALEDIDVAEAVTELSAKQSAYEAALTMASKTLNMSLLNYI